MIDFEPVEHVRGDGKIFWQPRCEDEKLYRNHEFFYKVWSDSRWVGLPSKAMFLVIYRSKSRARRVGRRKAKQCWTK